MQVCEVSETGVWRVQEIGPIFCQTVGQTPVRHLPIYSKENSGLKVSDKCLTAKRSSPKCYCLTGGVSLGRASPDTQTDNVKMEVIR